MKIKFVPIIITLKVIVQKGGRKVCDLKHKLIGKKTENLKTDLKHQLNMNLALKQKADVLEMKLQNNLQK